MSVERFASLTLDDKLKVAMAAAFIAACVAIGYSSLRMASFAKGELRPGGDDESPRP